MKKPSTARRIRFLRVLAVPLLWPAAALDAVPVSLRVVQEQADQATPVPRPFLAGLSGDYRGTQHSEQDQHKLYLQETPAGLLFDLFAHEPHPKRELSAEHSGTATQVAEGVYVQEWQSEDDDGKPAQAWFYITVIPSGKVDVTIRGTVARRPPFHTERNLEGTYEKVGPEADIFDETAVKAVEFLRVKEGASRFESPVMDVCLKAARLLGGGDTLAHVLFSKREKAAAFAVDVCSARQGNEYALQTVLMTLGGVRGGAAIDPGFALEVYEAAKENNPDLSGAYERPGTESQTPLSRELALIKLAAECTPLDFGAFLHANGISEASLEESAYAVWELAEDAAHGKRFGKPNAELAFQLVLRGGGSFEERAAAIRLSHTAWKSGGKQRFSIAACLSSPKGKQYLKQRGKSKPPAISIGDLKKDIQNHSVQALLERAYEAEANFISESARIFCGDEGFFAWELNGAAYNRRAMQQYLETIGAVLKGFKPKKDAASTSADSRLNTKYKLAMEGLENLEALPEVDTQSGAAGQFFYRNADALKRVQRAWLPVRDKGAQLFHALSPGVGVEEWKAWLTEARTRELPSFKQPSKPQ